MSESLYTFAFNVADIHDGTSLIPVDGSNKVFQEYSGRAIVIGDEAFHAELNRVLGNLYLIRASQPGMGTLISFVVDSSGNSFKVTLT